MYNLSDNGISGLKQKLQKKEIGFSEAISCFLERIKLTENLNCFIDVFEKEAMDKARELDRRFSAGGPLGPLAGVPVAVKDNIAICGKVNSCCSNFLRNMKATSDAEVVKKLKNADAVLIGKTNMDEFAMGTSNETSCYGPVLNPVDNTRVPGGSSGGSACAVAAGDCLAALGTDTGGSIRQPSSHCGVVGFKPTKNAVKNRGIVALAPSLDQVGILAGDTISVKEVFEVLSDLKTSQSRNKIFKVGLADEFIFDGMSNDIARVMEKAVNHLKDLGVEFVKISIPSFKAALADYMILSYAEASVSLDRFDGIVYGNNFGGDAVFNRSCGFGNEAKRRIMLGKYFITDSRYEKYYLRALGVRNKLREELHSAFTKCDFIMTPSSLMTAYKLGEDVGDHKEIAYSDMYTVLANLADLPAVSVPFGKDSIGLPIGIHFIGRKNEDIELLDFANLLEKY